MIGSKMPRGRGRGRPLPGAKKLKVNVESDEDQMEEDMETPIKKIAPTDSKKKKGNSGAKTTKSVINKSPVVKKRKAKVIESDAEENEDSDSEAKDDQDVPQTARRSVAFRTGQSVDQGLPDRGKHSDSISQPLSAHEVESQPSVDLRPSSHRQAEQILDDVGINMEKSKAAAPSLKLENQNQSNQRTSRPGLNTSKTPILPPERSHNQLIDEVIDNVTKTHGPQRLPPGIPYKIPKISIIDGYPPAPVTGQNQVPSVGEYSRHGNASGEKFCNASPVAVVPSQRMTKVDKKESDVTKAELQSVYSAISGTVLPAFGPLCYDRAKLEMAMKTGQWEKLKNVVIDKRMELENKATESQLEASDWKNKFQQQQQKVSESADIFKQGLDIFKRGLDNLVATFSIPVPQEKPAAAVVFPLIPKAASDQPIGSRRSILPAPISSNDEPKFPTRPKEPSYQSEMRSTTSSQPYPTNRGGYSTPPHRPAQFVQRFNRGRPFNRGGFNGRGQFPQRDSFNDGRGYGHDEGESRRSRMDYADLDAPQGEEYVTPREYSYE